MNETPLIVIYRFVGTTEQYDRIWERLALRGDELKGLGYAHAGAKNDFGGMTVIDFIAGPSAFEKLKAILLPIIESVGGSVTYESLSAHKMFAEAFDFDLQPA